MSDLIRVEGDLIEMAMAGKIGVLVHGCNCYKKMGSGFAKALIKKFPAAYSADLNHPEIGFVKLGNWSWSRNIIGSQIFDEKILVILNAYTQVHYGKDGLDRFEYAAFQCILDKLIYFCEIGGNPVVGFPNIGSGLAGGDQERITSMIDSFADRYVGKTILVDYKV